ncbi:g10519 [Coccomyxa elongata]
MTRVRLKKAVELPPQVREIVDKVINTPFEALPSVLEGFSWRFEKGDFNHWATLFNYFDELLERALTTRRDLSLKCDGTGDDTPFPSRSLLAILRVSAIILENCSNKHLYHSYEGLDLAACTQSDEEPIRPILALGTTLNFPFYLDPSNTSQSEPETSGARIINLQHVDKYVESEHDILRQLVERFAVPEKLRFTLLTRITVARNFSSLEGRRHLARLRLLSLHILFQCNPSAEAVADFYSQEPEFVSDLVGLLVAGGVVPEDLRILALRVLAVQLLDRAHHGGVITAISSGGQSGLLSMLMHRSIALVAGVATPEDGSGDQPTYSVQFVDALLTLVGALSASTSGCSALAEAGTLSALLPLLKDFDPAHAGLVASAVRILEAYMDFAPNSATQFREMGGLSDMIERLKAEVSLPQPAAGPEDMQTDAPVSDTAAGPSQPAGEDGAVQASAPAAAAPKAAALISYQRRVLLKALLRTIALTSYAPGASARPQEEDTAALFACLRRIFESSHKFGGGLFALAASIMSDQLHHDPLTFNALEQAGLPEAFLNALKAGVLPSGEAVVAVPTTLVALSLNEKGLTSVKESKALDCFVPIFTTSTYLRALQA